MVPHGGGRSTRIDRNSADRQRRCLIDDGCVSSDRTGQVARGRCRSACRFTKKRCPAPGSRDCGQPSCRADPASWVVRGGKLIVYGGGSQTFSLVYAAAKPNRRGCKGIGRSPRCSTAPAHRVRDTATARLNIAANGTVTGTDGCRAFTGTVSTSGSHATSRSRCPSRRARRRRTDRRSRRPRAERGGVLHRRFRSTRPRATTRSAGLSFAGQPTGGPEPAAAHRRTRGRSTRSPTAPGTTATAHPRRTAPS